MGPYNGRESLESKEMWSRSRANEEIYLRNPIRGNILKSLEGKFSIERH